MRGRVAGSFAGAFSFSGDEMKCRAEPSGERVARGCDHSLHLVTGEWAGSAKRGRPRTRRRIAPSALAAYADPGTALRASMMICLARAALPHSLFSVDLPGSSAL